MIISKNTITLQRKRAGQIQTTLVDGSGVALDLSADTVTAVFYDDSLSVGNKDIFSGAVSLQTDGTDGGILVDFTSTQLDVHAGQYYCKITVTDSSDTPRLERDVSIYLKEWEVSPEPITGGVPTLPDPIAYWSMDSLAEGALPSSTALLDDSGNGHDGVISDGICGHDDGFNMVVMTGAQKVTVPNFEYAGYSGSEFSFFTHFTIAMSPQNIYLLHQQDSVAGVNVQITATTIVFGVASTEEYSSVSIPASVQDNVKRVIGVTYNRGEIKVFLDFVEVIPSVVAGDLKGQFEIPVDINFGFIATDYWGMGRTVFFDRAVDPILLQEIKTTYYPWTV